MIFSISKDTFDKSFTEIFSKSINVSNQLYVYIQLQEISWSNGRYFHNVNARNLI